MLTALQGRYGEQHRAYHDWHHVEEMLGLFGEIENRLHDPNAVLFAILFHDAVYDPQATDNEIRSTALLREQSADLLEPASLNRAEAMVLATIRHELPTGLEAANAQADCAYFLDLDLAILGAAPERFAEYERQIRREYAHVPDDVYCTGRAAILRSLAARPHLYFSPWGLERFEKQARKNLARHGWLVSSSRRDRD